MSNIVVQINPDVPPTGSDLGIVNAARRSFGRRSEWGWASAKDEDGVYEYPVLKEKDKRLLEFLVRGMSADDFDEFQEEMFHSVTCQDFEEVKGMLWTWRNTPAHDTPFNHGFFSFEVKTPIFVRAQLVKHEYLIMSEYSRRYITDDIEFYEPDYWRKAAEDKKQGSLEKEVDNPDFITACSLELREKVLELYDTMLSEGVAPEQARMDLPQSLMTSWTWSGTLGAFAKMCQLRLAADAQYETRLVAQEVYKHLQDQFPVAAKLLVEGVK